MVLDLIFPPVCAGCQHLGSWLCPRCALHLFPLEKEVSACAYPGLRKIWSGYRFAPPASSLVKSVKYEFASAYIPTMATILDIQAGRTIRHWNLDVLVPVPLASDRLAWRGFNQAELLAQALGKRWGIPCIGALERVRWRKTQAKSNQKERQKIRHDFQLLPIDLTHKRVGLIDDVVTTGGTLAACARELEKANPAWIGAITFAHEV